MRGRFTISAAAFVGFSMKDISAAAAGCRSHPSWVRAKRMGLLRFVGNASSFLNGIQAKRVSFNDPCAEISGPQSAKPGLSSEEPASFFTGVVAGTEDYSLRRWNSGG